MTQISNKDGDFTILHCNSWERSAQLCKAIGQSCKMSNFYTDQIFQTKFYSKNCDTFCNSAIGKQLTVPKDLDENEKFYRLAKAFGRFQLGIRERDGEGWVDEQGQGLTFKNWAPNFPEDSVPASQGVVTVDFKSNGTWENKWMTTEYHAICV